MLAGLALYLAVYIAASITRNAFWTNILSPLGALTAFALVLAVLKRPIPPMIRLAILLVGLADLTWFAGDIGWAICNLVLKLDPENSFGIQFLYTTTTALLCASVGVYCAARYRNWNAVQLLVDTLTSMAFFLLMIYYVVFDGNLANISWLGQFGSLYVANLVLDILLISSIIIWLLSFRSGKVMWELRLLMLFLIFFASADLIYFYLDMQRRYVPNSLIDVVFIIALLGISCSYHLIRLKNGPSLVSKVPVYSNIGPKRRSGIALVPPILTMLLLHGLDSSLLIFVLIYILHFACSSYIQTAIRNAELLKREHSLNAELEERIVQRTREIVEKNRSLARLVDQDTVTDLYNRRYFMKYLEQRITWSRHGERLAVLLLDVDRFKIINDTYGHRIGDQVLVELADRLRLTSCEDAVIARLGGDEFVIAIPVKHAGLEIQLCALDIIDRCTRPISISGHEFRIAISLGISVFPDDAPDSETLLRHADIAMYQAKASGSNQYVAFNDSIQQSIQRKHMIELLLKRISFNQEFKLFYQPQFSIPDNRLIGMEALLRWSNPDQGVFSPGEFIPIAEETDQILAVGNWVIQNAIEQIADWNARYHANLKMGINISPKQLAQSDFTCQILAEIARTGIRPDWLDLEITEGVAIKGEEQMTHIFTTLRKSGISISIDDFGTGYSSLSYWRRFPFNRVKIDKTMVDHIETLDYDRQIVKSIVALADVLNLQTLAEGVETAAQYAILVSAGCRQIQGFYLGCPVSPEDFERLYLEAGSCVSTIPAIISTAPNMPL